MFVKSKFLALLYACGGTLHISNIMHVVNKVVKNINAVSNKFFKNIYKQL